MSVSSKEALWPDLDKFYTFLVRKTFYSNLSKIINLSLQKNSLEIDPYVISLLAQTVTSLMGAVDGLIMPWHWSPLIFQALITPQLLLYLPRSIPLYCCLIAKPMYLQVLPHRHISLVLLLQHFSQKKSLYKYRDDSHIFWAWEAIWKVTNVNKTMIEEVKHAYMWARKQARYVAPFSCLIRPFHSTFLLSSPADEEIRWKTSRRETKISSHFVQAWECTDVLPSVCTSSGSTLEFLIMLVLIENCTCSFVCHIRRGFTVSFLHFPGLAGQSWLNFLRANRILAESKTRSLIVVQHFDEM